MADYDSDSSGADDIETGVTLGYASKEATGDDFSQIGGHPVWTNKPRHTYGRFFQKRKYTNNNTVLARPLRHPFRRSRQMQSLQRTPEPAFAAQRRPAGQIPRPREESLPVRMQEQGLPQERGLSARHQDYAGFNGRREIYCYCCRQNQDLSAATS
jgi:hypothetical protein